jgi:hypothetical protein
MDHAFQFETFVTIPLHDFGFPAAFQTSAMTLAAGAVDCQQ